MSNGMSKETFEACTDINTKLNTLYDCSLSQCKDIRDIRKDIGKLPCSADKVRMNGMQKQINWLWTLVLGVPSVIGIFVGVIFHIYRIWPFKQ